MMTIAAATPLPLLACSDYCAASLCCRQPLCCLCCSDRLVHELLYLLEVTPVLPLEVI